MAENLTPTATTKWEYLRDEIATALKSVFNVVSEGVTEKTKGEQVVYELQQDVPTEIKALGAVRHGYGKFILFVPDTENVSNPSAQADHAGIINDKVDSLFERYEIGSRPRLIHTRYTITLQRFELLPALNTVQGYVREARVHYAQVFKRST